MTDRILQGAAATLQSSWYTGETVADPGAVTVTVTAGDGTVVADAVSADGTGADARTVDLTASDTSTLTWLTAAWTSATLGVKTSVHEVVGGFYLDLPDIRALDGLDNTTRHTTVELRDAREWFETLAEQWCGVAFVPRYGRTDRYRRVGDPVWLRPKPRAVQAVTVDGVTVTASGWEWSDDGYVHPDGTVGAGRIVIHHEHGYDRPDQELVEAAKIAVRDKLLTDQTGQPSRQVLLSNELGTVRLAQPGAKAATGIPEVDRVLNDRRFQRVMIG